MVSGFRLSDTDFRDEVSVHDYISEHRAGIALHRGGARRKEEKGNAAEKHGQIAPKKVNNFSFARTFTKKRVNLEARCTQWLQMRNGSGTDV